MTFPRSFILLAVILAMLLTACNAQSDKSTTEVVQAKIDEGAFVVDVRTPAEFESWHFEGAVNIDVDSMEQRLEEFGPKDRSIIVYCRSGRRSGIARDKLRAAGYQDVLNAGGLEDMARLKK